jgi:putative transposase
MPSGKPTAVLPSLTYAGTGNRRANLLRLKEEVRPPWVSELRRLRLLEEENSQLKRLVADLSLDKYILSEALRKKV